MSAEQQNSIENNENAPAIAASASSSTGVTLLPNEVLSDEKRQKVIAIINLIAYATRSIEKTSGGYKLHFFYGVGLKERLTACGLGRLWIPHVGFDLKKRYIEITPNGNDTVWRYISLLESLKDCKEPSQRSGALSQLLDRLPNDRHFALFEEIPSTILDTLVTERDSVCGTAVIAAALHSPTDAFTLLLTKLSKPVLAKIAFQSNFFNMNLFHVAAQNQSTETFMILIGMLIKQPNFYEAICQKDAKKFTLWDSVVSFGDKSKMEEFVVALHENEIMSLEEQYKLHEKGLIQARHKDTLNEIILILQLKRSTKNTTMSAIAASSSSSSEASSSTLPTTDVTPDSAFIPFLNTIANYLKGPIVYDSKGNYIIKLHHNLISQDKIFQACHFTIEQRLGLAKGMQAAGHLVISPGLVPDGLYQLLDTLTHLKPLSIYLKATETVLLFFLRHLPEIQCMRFINQLPQKVLSDLAKEKNDCRDNALHVATRKLPVAALFTLYKRLSHEVLVELAFQNGNSNLNVLQIAAMFRPNEVPVWLLNSSASSEKFPSAAFNQSSLGKNLFHYAIEEQPDWVCLFLIERLYQEEGFPDAIFSRHSSLIASVLHLAAQKGYDNVVVRLLELLPSNDNFTKDHRVEIFRREENVLDLAAKHLTFESFLKLIDFVIDHDFLKNMLNPYDSWATSVWDLLEKRYSEEAIATLFTKLLAHDFDEWSYHLSNVSEMTFSSEKKGHYKKALAIAMENLPKEISEQKTAEPCSEAALASSSSASTANDSASIDSEGSDQPEAEIEQPPIAASSTPSTTPVDSDKPETNTLGPEHEATPNLMVKTLRDYQAKHPSDVSVKKGENVEVINIKGMWCYVIAHSERGYIPSDYLALPTTTPNASSAPNAVFFQPADISNSDSDTSSDPSEEQPLQP